MEDDITNEHVSLIAPAENSQFTSTGITFTWDAIKNGTKYRIQVARPNFENPLQIVADNVVDTTSFTVQLNVGDYQWRVKAVNSGYETGFTTRSFSVSSDEDFENNSVNILTPSNNLVTNTPQQNMSWGSVLGATGYQFQTLNAKDNTVLYNVITTAPNLSYSFPEGSLKWRVRAMRDAQYTLYTSRDILTDFTKPNTPVPLLPTNLANTSNSDITFQWSRTAISGSAEKDSIYLYTDVNLSTQYYKNEQTSPYTTSALPSGTYYWYIKSFDAAGNSSPQSSTFSFTLN